eukprot:3252827-Amphidinium_carterae.3
MEEQVQQKGRDPPKQQMGNRDYLTRETLGADCNVQGDRRWCRLEKFRSWSGTPAYTCGRPKPPCTRNQGQTTIPCSLVGSN